MQTLPAYHVAAYNISQASENKIHDDAVAQSLGFTGGLVPGVEVYAYMCHQPVARWGKAFLTSGQIECRFFKPVYDGRQAIVTASGDGHLDIKVESDGVLCASATAGLHGEATPPLPNQVPPSPPPLDQRPPATADSLRAGTLMGIRPEVVDAERLQKYLDDIREQDPLYAREGIVHPGLLLRLCNTALKDNVLLAPWIHTGSHVRNFAIARLGDILSVRGHAARTYESKGHSIVDLDLTIVANESTLIAKVLHTAIYQLRHLKPTDA